MGIIFLIAATSILAFDLIHFIRSSSVKPVSMTLTIQGFIFSIMSMYLIASEAFSDGVSTFVMVYSILLFFTSAANLIVVSADKAFENI